jgi:hypothetical protein
LAHDGFKFAGYPFTKWENTDETVLLNIDCHIRGGGRFR